jgi:hypothetical protein
MCLCRPRGGARFNEVQIQMRQDVREAAAKPVENIGRQLSVPGTRFNEVNVSRCTTEKGRHLADLDGEELTEQRADVDARKKIARASRSPGRAGVVAKRRVVESKFHERGHGHSAAFTNDVNQRVCNPQSLSNLKSEIFNFRVPVIPF